MIYYKNSYLCRVLKPTIKSNREKLVRVLALRNGLDKKKIYKHYLYILWHQKKKINCESKKYVCV
jgi:hypothetical protein